MLVLVVLESLSHKYFIENVNFIICTKYYKYYPQVLYIQNIMIYSKCSNFSAFCLYERRSLNYKMNNVISITSVYFNL